MLGILTEWKDNLKSSAAEMVYGEPPRMPGEFIDPTKPHTHYVYTYIKKRRSTDGSNHGRKSIFIFKELSNAESVFLRRGGPKGMLQQPYEGPFKVTKRFDKTFAIDIRGHHVVVIIDRVKPAYVLADCDDYDKNIPKQDTIPSQQPTYQSETQRCTRSFTSISFVF
ncbi:hypothetical protein RI129_009930 [Pyrocoelia pectoralis]|uniref:Uncharacterized protein n=1 Tax=Pyrocoelia pectoralis TaxID=417401 RepID=A0AAN7V720_9COLE